MSRFKPDDEKLTPAQERLITAMLSSTGVREAAKKAKIAERTAWSYLALPHVKAALQQARDEVRQQALDLLQAQMLQSVETIVTLRDDGTVQPQHRIKAAQVILDHNFKPIAGVDDQPTASGINHEILPYLTMDQLNQISELQHQIDAILDLAWTQKAEAEQGIKKPANVVNFK
jgi:hypothetical protein